MGRARPVFENVIAQHRVVNEISRLVVARRVPGSILFEGPAYAGKLTTALELARVLTCREEIAAWTCQCQSCVQHRSLAHVSTKLLGPGNFVDEIGAASDVLRHASKKAATFFYVRAVRKLIRRFDPELWDPSDRRYKSASTKIDVVNDSLDKIIAGEVGSANLKAILESSKFIASRLPQDTIPVEEIRRLAAWVHTTSNERAKIAIVNGAERMSDGATNALLKLLEEPPRGSFFILIATQKESLVPTIRSRLRPFRFKERNAVETREVLRRVFHEESDEYGSIREYFLAWHLAPEIVRNQGKNFLDAVATGSPERFFSAGEDLSLIIENRDLFRAFLEQVLRLAGRPISNPAHHGETDAAPSKDVDSVNRTAKWSRMVHDAYDRVSRYNVNMKTSLEALYYSMRAD